MGGEVTRDEAIQRIISRDASLANLLIDFEKVVKAEMPCYVEWEGGPVCEADDPCPSCEARR